MIEGRGMTEPLRDRDQQPPGVELPRSPAPSGQPLPSIEIAIKDDEGNRGAGRRRKRGELCIKGPNVMTGYYNQPAETAAAFTADGFMRTGISPKCRRTATAASSSPQEGP